MQLFMGGADDPPFLTPSGKVPSYKNGLPHRLQPQHVNDVHVDILDLSEEGDFKIYQKIWKAVGLGHVAVVHEDSRWLEEDKNWKVLLRWVIVGSMDPKELRDTKRTALNEVRATRRKDTTEAP